MPVLPLAAGRVVTRRRAARLGSLRQAKEKTGVSIGTWQRVENEGTFGYTSLVRIVEALGWPGSAADLLLDGKDPDVDTAEDVGEQEAAEPEDPMDRFDKRLERIEEAQAELVTAVGTLLEQLRGAPTVALPGEEAAHRERPT